MSTEWSTFQSFQQTQSLLEAVNTLTARLQLEEAGFAGPRSDNVISESAAQEASEQLAHFLEDLEVAANEEEKQGPILGSGARSRQLVRRFTEARQDDRRFRSILFDNGILHTRRLLERWPEASAEERAMLLASLEDLRTLLEEHVHDDVSRLLGEI